MTNIETKALCALFRQAEAKSVDFLVETMLQLCDGKSGILLQDLWKWWKEHKELDMSKQQFSTHVHQTYYQDPWTFNPNIGTGDFLPLKRDMFGKPYTEVVIC